MLLLRKCDILRVSTARNNRGLPDMGIRMHGLPWQREVELDESKNKNVLVKSHLFVLIFLLLLGAYVTGL